MEGLSLYQSLVFAIANITIADKELTDVYARIVTVYYNVKTQQGIIGLEIGESLTPQITYNHEVNITITPSSSISAQDLVALVLANVPNSSVYVPE